MANREEALKTFAEKITQCSRDADQPLLKAAGLLREARTMFEKGKDGNKEWRHWAEQNLELRESRLRQLFRIARAEDPQKELERQLQQTRDRVNRYNENKKNAKTATLTNVASTVAAEPVTAIETSEPPQSEEAQQAEPARSQNGQRHETEPECLQLIEWARSAPPDHVRRVWRFASQLTTKPKTDQAAQAQGLDSGPTTRVAVPA